MRPDLVICCSGGSQADYVPIISKNWDSRFLFNRLPGPEFMDALFDQQRVLHEAGHKRNVLIIMDDAPVDKDVRNSITEVGYRGRHYNVSIWILAISFVMCPKGLRRSLDALFIMCRLGPEMPDRGLLRLRAGTRAVGPGQPPDPRVPGVRTHEGQVLDVRSQSELYFSRRRTKG